jgi:flagellar basal-body rod protein FlgF
MPDALSLAARIMADDVFRLNVVSQNLANANTAGYKKELVTSQPFVDYLQAGSAGGMRHLPVNVPTFATVVDFRQGPLTQTGNALDVALEGKGFFEVAGPGGPLYTRQGSLRIDAQGRLATASGLALAGLNGEIPISGTQPRIDARGRVFEGDNLVAQLKIVRFGDSARLVPLGGGLYRADGVTPGAVPLANDAFQVRQGFIESSNVATLPEMLRMIELVRRFESAQRVVQGYDGMLGAAIRALGEF